MLPTAPLPSTKLNIEDTLRLQPVKPTTTVIDVLSEFVPGQKMVALIQAQLANGAYRATIAQRDVTLALPFAAKAGDSLDLEVVQTEGRIAFAVSKPAPDAAAARSSATTTLSSTAQMIGQLLSISRSPKEAAAVLNGNRPILGDPAAAASSNTQPLQRALVQSGLFYESHQAGWVRGQVTEAALRTEPQSILTRTTLPQQATTTSTAAPTTPVPGSPGGQAQASASTNATGIPLPTTPSAARPAYAESLGMPDQPSAPRIGDSGSASLTAEAAKATAARSGLPAELAPVVQQQLSSLANNVYSFQGMIWAGQPFHWEIIDDDSRHAQTQPGEPERPWKTRLKLLLPSLGDIDATIALNGSDVSIDMAAGAAGTPAALRSARDRLRDRMELAGLRLMALDIRAATAPESENDDAARSK